MKKNPYKKFKQLILISFILLLSMNIPIISQVNKNSLLIKWIDLSGVALFNKNISIQYTRDIKNITLLTEIFQYDETINSNNTYNEGGLIGFSIPSILNIKPSLGYKFHNQIRNTKLLTKQSIVIQLHSNFKLTTNDFIQLSGRVITEEFDSGSDNVLKSNISLWYGYKF